MGCFNWQINVLVALKLADNAMLFHVILFGFIVNIYQAGFCFAQKEMQFNSP